ncbi:MAG TPA: PEP-CTERM sorting domain-containing protein [Acidobacteriaceae bacterium]|nr:PEP-CTERM sorting domain-containing protein [Acidobacteriaceae bacterium]
MKALVLALAVLISPAAFASTVDFASSTSTTNNTGGQATILASNSVWATALPGSSWITTADNVTPPNGTTVTYTVDLDIAGPFNLATLNLGVYADDTATVMLNGTTLFAGDMTLGMHCASGIIGCVDGTEGVLSNYDVTADVHDGVNTLTFEDYQLGASTFGVDFAGSLVTSDPASTPEPSSLMLLGSGLIGLAGLRRRFAR